MDNNKRGSWGSNFGFLMAAIGSAVGLGNIWGFPYKMGRSGGFTFVLIYFALAIFVGFAIMCSELALGRMTRSGPVKAYKLYTKRFAGIGWLALAAPAIILTFYSVLSGYCIYYIGINAAGIFGNVPGSESFGALLTNPGMSIAMLLVGMLICYFINSGGISGGIEKFNKIGMPALFFMLIIIIIRSLTLPNAVEGLKFMFVPGYAVEAGFIEETPNLVSILAMAGGQMFFSLSLAMGAMVTYGSYLDKKQNLPKNCLVIVICDSLVALMAGLAVIPAAVANGISKGIPVNEIKLSGPNLLFSTLQDVFHDMGPIGGVFGFIFYTLVTIAAISSAISLIEVVVTMIIDRNTDKGKPSNRGRITLVVCVITTAVACLVAADGLGSNGIAPIDLLHKINPDIPVKMWNDCWLDFMDVWSEGLAMPIGAMIMALVVGWEQGPDSLYNEIKIGYNGNIRMFYVICIRFIAPVAMAFITAGQITDFFGNAVAGYAIAGVLLVLFWVLTVLSGRKLKKG